MPVTTFLIFLFVSSFTPGPNNFLALSHANQYGFKATRPFCYGVGAGFFTLVMICSIFNDVLAKILPFIKLPLAILGAGYMLYLAYKVVMSIRRSSVTNSSQRKGLNNMFANGFVLQFINPKGVLFGITAAAVFIIPYFDSLHAYFWIALLMGATGMVSTLSWGLGGALFQNFIRKYNKSFNIVMALLLVYTAITILVN